ncbi:HK97-gp10 family putative phage morphogenesis protein [Croceicoccus sp. YJ47]|uniref:HK97-gp10 family putative phage morphogenesis protein n=1 Tax=Croceicoccus sp. YJ47 TaxID=2798724 RepID=UPI001923BFBE|nr:HK97-gp10 family putative phage morphogenesis protein [Croceicoccus sp. YJ47]QQN73951.1 HK97 gp10 family phage protein [Croceicoccus sp. YJ47]
MAREVVQLIGMRELERALGELPKATRRRTALNALRKGAEPLAKAARALAPTDKGNLKEGIKVSATLARSQRGYKGSIADVEMYVGPGQHPQAITQEFGTFKEPAQPYMRPAWSLTRYSVLDLIGAHLGIEIEKTAARERRKAERGR